MESDVKKFIEERASKKKRIAEIHKDELLL
jgi:hypothetical protein